MSKPTVSHRVICIRRSTKNGKSYRKVEYTSDKPKTWRIPSRKCLDLHRIQEKTGKMLRRITDAAEQEIKQSN